MNVSMLKEFFMWMTILNLAIFMWSAIMCIVLKDFIARMHGKMFGMGPDAIKTTVYHFLGAYKIVFIVFFLVPWLALLIIS